MDAGRDITKHGMENLTESPALAFFTERKERGRGGRNDGAGVWREALAQ